MKLTGFQSRESGFSLVEVMAVIALIALVSVTAITQISPPRSPVETEAERLALRLETVRRNALATGALAGFSIDGDGLGYTFMDLQEAGWRVRHGDRTLGPVRLPDGVRLYTDASQGSIGGGAPGVPVPDLWFDPIGTEPPVTLHLRSEDRSYAIVVSALAPVEVSRAR